mmetsp:Transcript_36532/g.85735  ORF Transcript_36532/g.85735 Transcript_36532/m.85735 type:complete len:238 (-) Transcript_36532:1319-2032(-)
MAALTALLYFARHVGCRKPSMGLPTTVRRVCPVADATTLFHCVTLPWLSTPKIGLLTESMRCISSVAASSAALFASVSLSFMRLSRASPSLASSDALRQSEARWPIPSAASTSHFSHCWDRPLTLSVYTSKEARGCITPCLCCTIVFWPCAAPPQRIVVESSGRNQMRMPSSDMGTQSVPAQMDAHSANRTSISSMQSVLTICLPALLVFHFSIRRWTMASRSSLEGTVPTQEILPR